MYTISEVAEIIGISRYSVYRIIERPEITEHIRETKKGKIVTEAGLEILKKLNLSVRFTVRAETAQLPHNEPCEKVDFCIDILLEQIEYLKTIIAEKDRQLSEKDKQILILINRNMGVNLPQNQTNQEPIANIQMDKLMLKIGELSQKIKAQESNVNTSTDKQVDKKKPDEKPKMKFVENDDWTDEEVDALF